MKYIKLQRYTEDVYPFAQKKTSILILLKRFAVLSMLLVFTQQVSYSLPVQSENQDSAVKDSKRKVDTAKDKSPKVDTNKLSKAQVQKALFEIDKTYSRASIGVIIIIGIVCLAVCGFLIYAANISPRDNKSALGLPDGSIRALIALLTIVFYILVSIALTFSGYPSPPSPLATDVTKTLGILVVAVSAFYFGSKTAEQGNKTVTDNLNTIIDKSQNQNINTTNEVPAAIIQQAIQDNAASWKTLYQCINIKVGKKTVQDTINNLNCILFIVLSKDLPVGAKTIPLTINYNFQGKVYNIPTDVTVG